MNWEKVGHWKNLSQSLLSSTTGYWRNQWQPLPWLLQSLDHAGLISVYCHAVWKQSRFFPATPLWWYESIGTSLLTFYQLPSNLIYCQGVSYLEFSNLGHLSINWSFVLRTSHHTVLYTSHSRKIYLFMALFSEQSKL